MEKCTREVCRSVIKADQSMTIEQRNRLLAVLNNPEILDNKSAPVEPRLLRRAEAAHRLGIGLRALDGLCRGGALPKVKLPGRIRSCGVREADLLALIEGRKP